MEKIVKPTSGWTMLTLLIVLTLSGIAMLFFRQFLPGGLALFVAFTLIAPGFLAIEPNSTRVLTLFGDYIGSAKDSGFFFRESVLFEKSDFPTRRHARCADDQSE